MSGPPERGAGPNSDAWTALRSLTPARIARGRVGSSLPTVERLAFLLDHARARDAVRDELDSELVAAQLAEHLADYRIGVLSVTSQARSREEYLLRPDRGRRVSRESLATVIEAAQDDVELSIVIADGLSAQAAHRHSVALVSALVADLVGRGWRLSPIVLVRNGRVAIADEIGEVFRARLAVVVLGERPGLSAPDSLGAYVTFGPRVGRTDAERNCVSNIRPDGLDPLSAATVLSGLLRASTTAGLSGVALKADNESTVDATATLRDELVFSPRKAVTMADSSSNPRVPPLEGAIHRSVGGVHEDVVEAGDGRIKRVVYPPGYRWSTHLGPTVGTALCMHAHVGFLVQGQMLVEYPDGCTVSFIAPQAVLVDPGHDACVLGDETAVLVQVDFERDTVARFNLPTAHTH